MKCPRCGLQQEQSEECRGCGVIIARYLEKQAAALRPSTTVGEKPAFYLPLTKERELRRYYNAQSQLLRSGLDANHAHRNFLAGNPAIKRLTPYSRIGQSLEAGDPISDGMLKSPAYFPEHHVSVVKAGEQSGNPAQSFDELYTSMDRKIRTIQAILKALRKPVITLVSSFFVLPLPTLFTNGVKGYLGASLLPFVLMLTGLFVIWQLGRAAMTRESVALPVDRVLLYLPVYKSYAINQFVRIFRALYAAGIEIPTAFARASAATGNRHLARTLAACVPRFGHGESLTAVLHNVHVLPTELQQFMATGEASGSLDVSLRRYAEIADEQFEHQLTRAGTTLAFTIGTLITVYIGYQIIQGFEAEIPKIPLPRIQP